MQTFDVVVLGAGQTGTRIANHLSQKNLKIALVALPHKREDYLQELVAALSNETVETVSTHESAVSIVRFSPVNLPTFLSERTLSINDEEIRFDKAVLACGAGPNIPPDRNIDFTSPAAWLRSAPPPRAAVWGDGPVGVGTALRLANQNCQVQLISKHARVLPHEDEAISNFSLEQLQRAGVTIQTNTPTTDFAGPHIACTGIKPNTDGLNLKIARVYADATGRVVTDSQMRTSNPHVYAAGAVTGPPFHLSFERYQADLVSENVRGMFFMIQRFMPEPFPLSFPFDPPLARVGLTAEEARTKFKDTLVISESSTNGFVKLVARQRSAMLLGAHAAGVGAAELILFFDLLMRAEIPLREISERHHFPSSPLSNAAANAVEKWIALAGR